MKNRIIQTVQALVEEHDERDPFALCKALGISVMMQDFLSEIKGYYFLHSGIQVIVINANLNRLSKKIVCAHELGHALMHEYYALRIDMSVYDVSARPELEANLFAAELLITDEEVLHLLEDYPNYFDLAKELGVTPQLLDFKIRLLKHKGHPLADFANYSKTV